MGRVTVWSAAFLATGGFLFGFDSGIITSTIALATFKSYFGDPSDAVAAAIVSSFQGGAILGTVVNMLCSDRLGRRSTVFLGALLSVAGSALQAASGNLAALIAGRFIGGAAVGILTSTIPMYASELAEARQRGKLSGLLQWMLSWGFLVAQWLGYGCSFVESDFSWRFPLAFQCIPGIIIATGIYFLEESPRWLVEKGRHAEARRSLDRLRAGVDEKLVDAEYAEIRHAVRAQSALRETGRLWKAILTKPSWRRRLLLGCGVQAFSPLSGINVINYFGPRIYDLLGIGTQTSLMLIGVNGALGIIYNTVGLWMLDRVGRVRPLIASALGLAAALLVNAVQFQFLDRSNAHQLRSMVAMNFVFGFFFTPLGIISWVYPAEIFPLEIRALGNALTTFTNWSINLLLVSFSPQALTAIGFRFFYVFFVFNVIAALCYYLFYPETSGRTLEQMDELFGDVVPMSEQSALGTVITGSDSERGKGLGIYGSFSVHERVSPTVV
ncbi:Hexose transporter [Colletotrichum higginsianum IMI 349063]|uniref:Hexose transporter n=3 Tax=Colletotrichum higginsianum TaxID=80884 RepID=A0A1B7YGT4_COLHI|nr:Hexose transporter [Colletotrichum higginsianum IMI 349063]OBR11192.1 Hexose transporter [Colletotrichum higginsianum IMI 349063]TIC90853.1 High-affinity glucose transporter [Colletotrichum higginsianum]